MRRLLLLLALMLFAPAPPAAAQGAGAAPLVACNPKDTPAGTRDGRLRSDELLDLLQNGAPTLRLERNVRQRPTTDTTLEFTVRRPDGLLDDEWRFGWFEALAYPSARSGAGLRIQDIREGSVQPPAPRDESTDLTVRFTALETGWWPSRWEVVLIVCPAPPVAAVQAGKQREVGGFARETFYASTLRLAAVASAALVVLLYLGLALATMQVQRMQYRELRQRLGPAAPTAFGFALRPTAITQDSFGFASLSRFQILLFTLALSGVYAFVLIRSGELPTLSNSVLMLLGITLTGSALARAAEGSSVATDNRIWLLGTGVIDSSPRIPRWSDLIASDGEIDASRVQALVFSLFAAIALVAFGTSDLEKFEIPDELNYLITISQGAYVAGRALPREAAKRLNDEVRIIREAEMRILADPADAAAAKTFETARNALVSSLLDVFGERFDDQRLRRLQPGDRTPPPPALPRP